MSLPADTRSFDEELLRERRSQEQRFEQQRVQLQHKYDRKRTELQTSLDHSRAALKQDLVAGVISEQDANERQELINEKKLEHPKLKFECQHQLLKLVYDEERQMLQLDLRAKTISPEFYQTKKQKLELEEENGRQRLRLEEEHERQRLQLEEENERQRLRHQKEKLELLHESAKLRQQLKTGDMTTAENHQQKHILDRDHGIRDLKWQLDNHLLNAEQYQRSVDTALLMYRAEIEAATEPQLDSILRFIQTRVRAIPTEATLIELGQIREALGLTGYRLVDPISDLYQQRDHKEAVESISCIREIVEKPKQFGCNVEIVKFINGLRGISLAEDDEVLSLPESVFLEGSPAFSFLRGELLIRECYRKLRDIILNRVNAARCNQTTSFIVQANPGIGKSQFCCFMIYTLMKMGKTIIWEPRNAGLRVCITKDSIEFGDGHHGFLAQLGDRSSWYIVDGKSPQSVLANTLLVCSFQWKHWYSFSKMGAIILYMPVWTWDEVKKAHEFGLARDSRCNGEVTLRTVEERFYIWGGIPAHVFKHGADDFSTDLLETAISEATLDDLLVFATELEKTESLNYNLLHLTVSTKGAAEDGSKYESHGQYQVIFASAYIRDRVTAKLLCAKRESLMAFLSSAATFPLAAALRQYLFEGYSHKLLSDGGTFRVREQKEKGVQKSDRRSISTNDVSVIQLNKTRVKLFRELTEVTSESGVYWETKDLKSETIDSLVFPNVLFKVTVSEDDPIPILELGDVVQTLYALRKGSEELPAKRQKQVGDDASVFRLYYAVPASMFETYRKQIYTTWRGEQCIGGIPVEQYTLEVCLTSAPKECHQQ